MAYCWRNRLFGTSCTLPTAAALFYQTAGALIDGRRYPYRDRSYWEVDHIVPVAEGGGACGLENLRTLCYRCHPAETGKLRRRLNAMARA